MDSPNSDCEKDEDILTRLRLALREYCNDPAIEGLPEDASLTDVLESLGHFGFLLTLEETFGVQIPDHKYTFSDMGTLSGISAVIREHT